LSTLKRPPEEEIRGGVAVLEHVEHEAADVEGTSMVMVSVVEACGLMLVISMSFTKSMPISLAIIIII
jgi:hypothetical protein